MSKAAVESKEVQCLDEIVSAVNAYLHPRRIILFGSRAAGRGRRYSDFDIAYEGAAQDPRGERRLKEALDERLGIFTVDLINLDVVDSAFKQLVMEKGRIIYER